MRRQYLASLVIFVLTAAVPVSRGAAPAASNPLLTEQWPAFWITCPGAPHNEYGVHLFRKTFQLDRVPEHLVVHVSADARYRLWVNGQPAAFGPQRGAPSLWRYDTLDLAPLLRAGRNVLAARVISYGGLAPLAIMTLRTGFLLQGDGDGATVLDTNSGWKTLHDEAYQPFRADFSKVPGYFAVGPGDRVDAARHPWGWETVDFDDQAWPAARELDHGLPWGRGPDVGEWLVQRNLPPMEETPVRFAAVRRASGVEVPENFVRGGAAFTVPPHTRARVLLDHGSETNAFVQLQVGGGRGSRVGLTYAEALLDAQGRKGPRDEIAGREVVGLGDEFLPDGAPDRVFAPIDYRTYRYLQLDVETADEPLVVKDLRGDFTGYPFRERGAFASDDPTLSRIWQVGWRTARLCAFETYVDCPYYEQLQYVGDTRIQGLISLYVSGDDRLLRNAIDLLDHSRFSDGLTRSRYPSEVPQVINTFSLFWIEMVRDYWMHRDDPGFVQERLPGVESVLGWFERRIDHGTGLLGPLDYWSFVDWAERWPYDPVQGLGGEPAGARAGGSAIISLQLAGTLDHAAELCRAFGRTDLAARYAQESAGLKQAVMQRCWDEKRRMLADSPARTSFSQHVNTLAVLTGAVQGDAARDLMGRVAHDGTLTPCSTYFRFYLLRAMKQAGLGDEYLSMLGPWKAMLDTGLTTFAEQPDPTRSDCHAWSASPVYELLATVCGIEPASPGFATVRIEPHLGPLHRASGTVPHPKGDISVNLERAGTVLKATITLPPGLGGEFVWRGRTTLLHSGSQNLTMP